MNIQHAAPLRNLRLSPLSTDLPQTPPDVDAQVGDTTATAEPALPDGRQTLRKKLSDRQELHNLAKALDTALEKLPEDATPEAVAAYFLSTHLTLASADASPRTASLESLIKAASPYYPKTRVELQELAQNLCEHVQKHPLGNLSGALAWTLPLSIEHQRTAYNVIASNSANLPGLPLPKPGVGALDYLANAVTLSPQLMQDPAAALEKLLDSPQAAALGAAVQASVGGIATSSSANDYVLATIHLSLDPEALDQKSNRNIVAGFDLGVEIHRDSSPASVVEALANHLSSTGRTSPATAALAARLLLMRVAPQFLIKDIPASVRCHSQAWANLCIAVAGIEAHTPGRTMNMSFAEVMCAAPSQYPASEAAKKNALIDWCVANDVIYRFDDAHYTAEDFEYARKAFNAQHEALKEASALLDKPLPNRERMAQERIQQHLGDDFPLDDKLFCLNYHKMGLKGQRFGPLYSLRELTMQGLKINTNDWVIRNNTKGVNLGAVALFTHSPHFNVPQEFDKQFAEVTTHCKKIHHYTWMNAITQLPVADRDILNNAKLSFYQENTYRSSPIPFWPNKLFHTSPRILMQAELKGEKHVYEFDPVTATIQKASSGRIAADEYIANEVTKIEALPLSKNLSNLGIEKTREAPPVNTFKNPRIHDIAQMIVNAQGIDSDAVRRQAEGRTSTERTRDTLNTIGEFILDLIPLRTAIVNWRNGNYKDAAVDLAFDVFGFLTAGVGTVSKLLKGAHKTGNAISKLARATRIIGADVLSAFNPLGGLGDAAVGAGKLALAGAGAAGDGIQRLRGMARGSDLIEAGAAFDDVAIGLFKRGDKNLEASAVLHEGKWYAVDAGTREPYGPPLEAFVPTHTYMPVAYAPSHPQAHRFDPIGRPTRPRISSKVTRKELPKGSYVESMKGKLEPGHFLRGDGKDETLKKFIEEMYETYDAIKEGALPPRIVAPKISKTAPAAEVITEALKVSNGIVFGESHKEMASFKLLFDNVEKFKQEGVKKIYFEGVIDLPPKGIVDDGIGNLANPNLPRTQPTFDELKAKFELHGIEVLPLDHYYLTRHKDAKLGRTETGFGSRQRLEEFNYYASEVIQANSGTEKWLALVGHSHMNTTEGVPGLAEMTGSISIGVFDKPSPNLQNPLSADNLPGDLVIQV
ncbi:membrane-targeted effector domain-containing toxin [Pseudomonas sp. B329]|uniref:membrane-targeted effector domain-containing toxin n=1 Tax=Pseudomonas sp. B329 TaxID=1553459 RepID=UPI002003D06B|nr:membrane-targeted effector domain-containing toxin [Pseudomonas sp. B329]MCK3864014.1 hypothetical protein [Pseudomonas sp. B329]